MGAIFSRIACFAPYIVDTLDSGARARFLGLYIITLTKSKAQVTGLVTRYIYMYSYVEIVPCFWSH